MAAAERVAYVDPVALRVWGACLWVAGREGRPVPRARVDLRTLSGLLRLDVASLVAAARPLAELGALELTERWVAWTAAAVLLSVRPIQDRSSRRLRPVRPVSDASTLGHRFRHRRVSLGLSVRAVAAALGVGRTTLGRMESGHLRLPDELGVRWDAWLRQAESTALSEPARLRAARRLAGLSIEDLAARLGVPRKAAQRWERGLVPIPEPVAAAWRAVRPGGPPP